MLFKLNQNGKLYVIFIYDALTALFQSCINSALGSGLLKMVVLNVGNSIITSLFGSKFVHIRIRN